MSFVIAAYGLAALLVGGYATSIWLRRREARRALEAWGAQDESTRLGPAEAERTDGAGVGGAHDGVGSDTSAGSGTGHTAP